MSNMSYCRFENTLEELRDCWKNMDEKCSLLENRHRKNLIKLCGQIAENYIDDAGEVSPLEHEITESQFI